MMSRTNTRRYGKVSAVLLSTILITGGSVADDVEATAATSATDTVLPADRVAPYSMVCYGLSRDEAHMRRYIGSLRDLGCTQALALIYWWQHEPLEGDWWKGKYPADSFGDNYLKMIDLFVDLCHEMGIQPSLRLGDFDHHTGLWHPADPSGDIEPYAAWVGRIAERYRGRIGHYIIGDELNRGTPSGWVGDARTYLDTFLIPMSHAIRGADPDTLISACATSSSPATAWQMQLIEMGLPKYADGIACNLWHGNLEDRGAVQELMDEARERWPDVKFFSSGVGYAERDGIADPDQAARVAQTMFNLWDMGWDSAAYYLFTFSVTADTKQDFGLIGFAAEDKNNEVTDAWRAYQTIAHTFYNREQMREPAFEITLVPVQQLDSEAGSSIALAPPDVFVRSFIRNDDELLIYLTYRNTRQPVRGDWDVVVHSDTWGSPRRIAWNDYRQSRDHEATQNQNTLTIHDVPVAIQPTILVLRRNP